MTAPLPGYKSFGASDSNELYIRLFQTDAASLMHENEHCPTCGKLRKLETSSSQSVCECRVNPPHTELTPVAGSLSPEEAQLFEYLVLTIEQKGKDGSAQFFSKSFEPGVQNAVITQLETQGWYCKATPAGTTLNWYCSQQSPEDLEKLGEELRRLRGTTYEDIVVASAFIGPIVGFIYGAMNGDILHGLVVGSAVGFLPAAPMLIFLPFLLIYEKFFKQE